MRFRCQQGPKEDTAIYRIGLQSLIPSYQNLGKELNEFNLFIAFLGFEKADGPIQKYYSVIQADVSPYMVLKSFRQFQ